MLHGLAIRQSRLHTQEFRLRNRPVSAIPCQQA